MAHKPEAWESLLDCLAAGEALTSVCKREGMPSTRAVYDKIESDPEFSAQFRARRAIGVRSIVDDCLDIADTPALDAVAVADKRVRIDTRLRLAGKWLASEFGEKTETVATVRHELVQLTPDESKL